MTTELCEMRSVERLGIITVARAPQPKESKPHSAKLVVQQGEPGCQARQALLCTEYSVTEYLHGDRIAPLMKKASLVCWHIGCSDSLSSLSVRRWRRPRLCCQPECELGKARDGPAGPLWHDTDSTFRPRLKKPSAVILSRR